MHMGAELNLRDDDILEFRKKVGNVTVPLNLQNHTEKMDVSRRAPTNTGTAIFTAFLLAFLPAHANTGQNFDEATNSGSWAKFLSEFRRYIHFFKT
jgi:hypothetical protein